MKRTDNFLFAHGVKQGCILSLLLFNIFLNDLPDHIATDPLTYLFTVPRRTKQNTLLYADDLFLISKSKLGLLNCQKDAVASF